MLPKRFAGDGANNLTLVKNRQDLFGDQQIRYPNDVVLKITGLIKQGIPVEKIETELLRKDPGNPYNDYYLGTAYLNRYLEFGLKQNLHLALGHFEAFEEKAKEFIFSEYSLIAISYIEWIQLELLTLGDKDIIIYRKKDQRIIVPHPKQPLI
jgi:hypothetical protein